MSDQKHPRFDLKRYRAAHPLRPRRVQGEETDALTPMMKAIKAVHSVTSTGSTRPEDLERQRSAQEVFGRLVTPSLMIHTSPLTIGTVPAEWVQMNQGHDRRHVVLYCHGGGYTCGQLGYARVLAGKLALATGCDVLSFEYRLAPEHAYPAAVEDAAAAAGISAKYLYKVFREKRGLSPSDYLIAVRLKRGRALLHRTDLPVEAVARSVGYNQPGYFSSAFRRFFGRTPLQERASNQQEET